jgi:serine/threonine protein kinase
VIPEGHALDSQICGSDSAQVWLARDSSGAPVVLKLASNDDRVGRRFKREIDAMRLAAGPHVMPILGFDDSYSWYSMPVASRTLYDVETPTDLEECLHVLEAVTAALHPIHAVGQVHRDLKPQNILWLDDGTGSRWVVADFGIVRNAPGLTTEQLTQINGLTGSRGWAAPEQYRSAHHSTITADVFGAGAVLSWMLTAVQPVYGNVSLPSDPRLGAVLGRATDPDPTMRYADLNVLLKAVKDSAVASAASLESLIEAGEWQGVGSYITGQPSQLTRVVAVLPKLQQSQVREWLKADRPALVLAVSGAWNDLRADTNGLPFDDIDIFLSWGVIVLRTLVNEGEYDAAERVAIALFGATADIDQYKPARVVLDWLKGLNEPAQKAMESALHKSSSWDFFKEQVSDMWKTGRESDLVQRLREQ